MQMQGTLAEVRSRRDVKFLRVVGTVTGRFKPRWVAALRPRVHIMIRARRLFELPQILEFMKIGHGFGVPLLGFLRWKFSGAHVYGYFAAQPEIRVAGNMDSAYRKVRAWCVELVVARFEWSDATKFAKIGFRSVQNILETPAGAVLLVFTLRGCRNSEKNRAKKRKKPQHFSVHDVPAPELRHTYAVGKGRAGSAQAAASAYFTDSPATYELTCCW